MRRDDLQGSRALQLSSFAVILLASPIAQALQTVDARDGVAVEAILSIKEPTRVRIEGAPILDVVGNIQPGNCGSAGAVAIAAPLPSHVLQTTAEVLVECDRDKGEIYLRPIGTSTKPVNLFIASPHATYTLVLRRVDTPADTIVIRDSTPRVPNGAKSAPPSSASHIRGLKSMLVSMVQDRPPVDLRVEEVQRPVLLWTEARFTLLRQFLGRGLVGEQYLLQNVSAAEMILAEPEFDRSDGAANGQVLAIAVENPVLKPLETTMVFVIRRGGDR